MFRPHAAPTLRGCQRRKPVGRLDLAAIWLNPVPEPSSGVLLLAGVGARAGANARVPGCQASTGTCRRVCPRARRRCSLGRGSAGAPDPP
ncbi:MAG: PEP-CTERM sorting domain-containing protein [Verrucomicrobia bacterium]|nr:PEP-CTERM sorting domain-containing protein [Verrucomicrobiota bacterium]